MKALQGMEELRLRIGDYRLIFVKVADDTIEIRRVLHRREAYRAERAGDLVSLERAWRWASEGV